MNADHSRALPFGQPVTNPPTPISPVELIRKKRSGASLSEEELRFLIEGYVKGTIPDYQMSAFLMACFFRGMTADETLLLTRLMLHSGQVIDLSDIPGIKVDKHSTGGVGDKVSIILAPIVAACGVPVPMISGRGLGHTGGTLDKLESIPGFKTDISVDEYKRILKQTGVVMIGQTKDIAPADRKLYALRDVTATVECIPLIAGSILSKKLAEGIDALVLDVKTGRGAFMPTYDESVKLAETLVSLGTKFGKKTTGFITTMDQPLGVAVGNWLEVVESVECLRGTKGMELSVDLMDLTHTLAGAMLVAGAQARTIQEGMERSRAAVRDGSAYRKFLELVKNQGGDVRSIENLESYSSSSATIPVKAASAGFLTAIDSLEVGLTAIMLGAGRTTLNDVIDPKAGIVLRKKVGNPIEPGDTLAEIFTDREDALKPAHDRLQAAFQISSRPVASVPMIRAIVDESGTRAWERS